MELRDEDLHIESGCHVAHPDRVGGQHVAKLCTGIRITHLPTGISASSNEGRSQHSNKMLALVELRKILVALPDPTRQEPPKEELPVCPCGGQRWCPYCQ